MPARRELYSSVVNRYNLRQAGRISRSPATLLTFSAFCYYDDYWTDSCGAMPVKKYQEFIPHATLQDSVKRFWILEKEYTAEDEIEEVIPDPCVELIFNFGTAYSEIGRSPARELPNICLVGVLSKPLRLHARGLVKIVAVRFFAWGALSFLKSVAS